MKQKMKHRKGLWSPEEDQRLRDYIIKNNHGCWSSVPIKAGLQRNGKSCRLRWINYLRPGLKREKFTLHEEETILSLHRSLGNKWSQIAQHLPGRTDNEIKNYWHTYLKKKVVKPEPAVEMKSECVSADDTDCSSVHEPKHEASFAPLKPTDISSLPQSIVFAEWLNLDNSNINENNAHEREGASLNYFPDLDYGESDLMELLFMESMDYDASSSQDYFGLLQNANIGSANNKTFGGEEVTNNSLIGMKMENRSPESGFIMDYNSRPCFTYNYSNDELTMDKDSCTFTSK